jgi:hypothetical protein
MGITEFKLIYFDTNKGEKLIHSAQELHTALLELQNATSKPESVNLISPNGDILTIAIGADFGFIQFERSSLDSSYLIAVEKRKMSVENYREVDAGGTPTPIPEHACLSTEKVIDIALYYFDHLTIPNYVRWEEV